MKDRTFQHAYSLTPGVRAFMPPEGVGLVSDYRKTLWKMAIPALKKGEIEALIHVGLVSHHLIQFARECLKGEQGAAFYSEKLGAAAKLAEGAVPSV